MYTVENAKVLRHHYKFYSCGTMGYMKEGDALVYVGVCNLVIDLKNVSVKTILKDRDGHMFVRTDSFKLYHSPKEYEQDVFIKPSDYETISLLQRADWGRLVDCGFKTITEAIPVRKFTQSTFSISRLSREDLEQLGFDTSDVDDKTMQRIADKLGDDYCEQLFWISLEIIAEEGFNIPRKEGWSDDDEDEDDDE